MTNEPYDFSYENMFYATCDVARFSKLVTHLDLFRLSLDVPGDIIECGVFKGSSLYRFVKFRELLQNSAARKIWAFDAFDEFPEPNKTDPDYKEFSTFVAAAGSQSATIDEIQTNLTHVGLNKNIDFIKGDVLETVPAFCSENKELKISLLNIDVDLYEPTKTCLTCLYPLVSNGGIILLDDYGKFPGANKAISEFFDGTGEIIKKFPYSSSVSWIKKGA